MKQFCDRCEMDVTDIASGHLSGVEQADEQGNGTVTDDVDLCAECYIAFRQWVEHGRTADAVREETRSTRRVHSRKKKSSGSSGRRKSG